VQQPEQKPTEVLKRGRAPPGASKNAAREREKQALHLQRENILSQRTSSPARRAPRGRLEQIEGQITAMG